MRWSVAVLAILLAAALDASFGPVLLVGGLRGRLLPGVVVFIALLAPRKIVLRWAMVAGLLVDLLSPAIDAAGEVVVVPGPTAMSYALGAAGVLSLRGLLSKQSPFSPAAATLFFSLLAGLAFVAIWQGRVLLLDSAPPWPISASGTGSASDEFARRALAAVGDGLVAIPLVWMLQRTRPAWGFVSTTRVVPGVARTGQS